MLSSFYLSPIKEVLDQNFGFWLLVLLLMIESPGLTIVAHPGFLLRVFRFLILSTACRMRSILRTLLKAKHLNSVKTKKKN